MECAKDEKCIQIFQLPRSREFFMSQRTKEKEQNRAHTVAGERDECVEAQTNTCNKIVAAATKSSETRKININLHTDTAAL